MTNRCLGKGELAWGFAVPVMAKAEPAVEPTTVRWHGDMLTTAPTGPSLRQSPRFAGQAKATASSRGRLLMVFLRLGFVVLKQLVISPGVRVFQFDVVDQFLTLQ